MTFKQPYLTLAMLMAVLSTASHANDIQADAIDSLLDSTIEKTHQDIMNGEAKNKKGITEPEENIPAEPAIAQPPPAAPVNRFGWPNQEVGGTDFNGYNGVIENLLTVLSKQDNPKVVLESMITNGTLSLSPNDIYTLRTALDLIERAENSPIVTPNVINDETMIDIRDRYKAYTIYIHDSATTLIEFLDADGKPWPIFKVSPNPYFNTTKGEDNILWVTPKERHRKTNIFVTLNEYEAPIQFNLVYSNQQRNGISTFKIPFISPTNKKSRTNRNKMVVTDLDSALQNTRNAGNGFIETKANSKISFNDLSYLATAGRFKEGTEAAIEAQKVITSNPEAAEIWFYKEKFVIRTPYQFYDRYIDVVNSGGIMKVFVAEQLNSTILLDGNNGPVSVFIPDYHEYRNDKSSYQ